MLTVSLITLVAFAERCLKRSAPLNVTGLGASAVALFYSVYGERSCAILDVPHNTWVAVRPHEVVSGRVSVSS